MRDQFLESDSFTFEVNRIIENYLSSKSGRSSVSNISKCFMNQRFQNEFFLLSRKKKDRIIAIILSWWLPEEIGILLRMNLQEEIQKFNENKGRYFIEILLLQSKGFCINFLIETSMWHTRDFFGNYLTESNLQRIMSLIRPRMEKRKHPRRVIRHRGYRDKGTLRPSHRKINVDVNLNREEKEIQLQEKIDQDTLALIEGWVT